MRLLIGLCLCGAVAHNLVRHFKEHFVNIAACLCRRLEEFEAVFLCQGLSALRGNNSVGQVCFVCDEHFGHSHTGVHINLLQPIGDVVKSAFFGAVVHQDDAHGALVVCLRDCAEPFLTCCVPNLKLYSLVLHVNRLDLEVNSYKQHKQFKVNFSLSHDQSYSKHHVLARKRT